MLREARKPQLSEVARTHVDIFVDNYDQLKRWALKFTEHAHELAEDLLHDAFIQFTLSKPDLETIQNLEGYLFIVMRNLHLSQMRRASRTPLRAMSVVEFDTVDVSFWASDPRDRIRMRDELGAVCQYACIRKETAKAGSVLILRFFHGYYPEEIAQVVRTNRSAVEKRLRMARAEVRLYLENPQRLKFIGAPSAPQEKSEVDHLGEDLRLDLQRQIFRSRHGECIDGPELDELYKTSERDGIELQVLAHIVSCQNCLEQVNSLLDLPPLASRYPLDTIGKDPGKKGGSGGGGSTGGSSGGGRNMLDFYTQRRDAHFHHQPQELCVSVNGQLQGFQKVISGKGELTLILDTPEPLGFVEVFSEQGFRLLMLNVEPVPVGDGKQATHVELSDGRTIEANLNFSGVHPALQITYHDPELAVELAVDTSDVPDVDRARSDDEEVGGEATLVCPVDSAGTANDREEILSLGLGNTQATWRDLCKRRFWLRPATIAVVLSALVVTSLIYFTWTPRPTTITSAPELLKQATQAEVTLVSRPDLIIHRTVNLEERRFGTGELISTKRIEIWQNGEAGKSARRLFDEQGRLIAGEFNSDGAITIYTKKRKGQAAKSSPPYARSEVYAALGGQGGSFAVWQHVPSAIDFNNLVATLDRSQLVDNGDRYTASYSDSDTSGDMARASLVINKSDLRSIEQTLVVRQHGPNAGLDELIEYHFIESSFEQRAPDTVAPSVFEPDAELLVPDVAVVKSVPRSSTSEDLSNENPANGQPLTANSAVATADLEVEVLRLLNQAGADADDQTNVSRTPDGKLLVTGLVDTKEKKNEIVKALASVANNPAVVIRIETYAEAAARQKQSASANTPLSVDTVTVEKSRIAVFDDVARHVGSSDEEAVRRFSAGVLNRSRAVMSKAGTLKKLAGRFSRDDLKSMTPEARAKWLAMVRTSARGVETESRRLRLDIQSVFYPGAGANAGDGAIGVATDDELQQAAARLFAETAANDHVIRSAFTISADGSSGAAIRNSGFASQLARVEALAASLQRVK